ncbi:MAG TPA: MOSC domain-containing protein [Candidatus Baltobacteraceae bacterium]|nr:MOSC domain-containing protein [Candidatus Baltobacteraceae bacterium]
MDPSRIESVNVASPESVRWRNQTFTTSIRKKPLEGRVRVEGINIDGDDQADRTVHGGRSKSVYAYSVEDYAWWKATHGVDWRPGLFGENLTTSGIDLGSLLIGERLRIGNVVLEASEPRLPCYKLGFAMNDPRFPKLFAAELRLGSYFRIIEPGEIGAGDTAAPESRPQDHDVTVREVGRIRLFAPNERRKLANVEALNLAIRSWAREADEP